MSAAFDLAFRWILSVEGGYVLDPQDPGGETKFGISAKSYPFLSILELTEEDAKAIYKKDYWDRCGCDNLPGPIALVLFDSAVHQGTRRAIALLQRSLQVVEDGLMGPETIGAAQRRDPRETVLDFLSHRAVNYSEAQERYKRGFFRRLFRLQGALAELFT